MVLCKAVCGAGAWHSFDSILLPGLVVLAQEHGAIRPSPQFAADGVFIHEFLTLIIDPSDNLRESVRLESGKGWGGVAPGAVIIKLHQFESRPNS